MWKVEVTPGATVDLHLVGDDIIVVDANADKENVEALEAALENARNEEEEHDFVGFYKKLTGSEDIPDELARVADRIMKAKDTQNDIQEDVEEPPPLDDDVVAEYDEAGGEDGDNRRLAFCTGYNFRRCGCFTKRTGNMRSKIVTAPRIHSHLQVYRGIVNHSIIFWYRHRWVVSKNGYAVEGNTSKIRAHTINGSKKNWIVRVTFGDGDGYNWRYC